MADILYQPGVPGGGTLTTQIPGAPPPGQMSPVGFDMDFLKQLALRKAAQEDADRNMARKMMRSQMRSQPRQPLNRISGGDAGQGQRRPRGDDGQDTRELWVNGNTGQPSQPWLPGAVRVGVNQRLGAGSAGGSASFSGGDDGADTPDAPDRWKKMAAQAAQTQPDDNPGRGGMFTKATGMGGW